MGETDHQILQNQLQIAEKKAKILRLEQEMDKDLANISVEEKELIFEYLKVKLVEKLGTDNLLKFLIQKLNESN